MASKRTVIEEWIESQKRHHLSDTQVQMARELGFKPDSLRKIDNHKQELWKAPLPDYIESLYERRFKREAPLVVKPFLQQLKEYKILKEKKEKKKKEKAKRRQEEKASEN